MTATSSHPDSPESAGSRSDAPQPAGLAAEILDELQRALPNSTCTHTRTIPARHSRTGEWPQWVEPSLRQHLIDQGISQPWSHQVATADALWRGQDTICSTGTASGKSLGYQLPILSALAEDATATAIYVSPSKALAQDQLSSLARLCAQSEGLRDIMVAAYDGDTPSEARQLIRDEARVIVTNPDMLHASILSNSTRWSRVLRTVRYIIIDECHVYRGVFGAHVAMVLRRLLRLANAGDTGRRVTVGMASATSIDPVDHAQRLTGREGFTAITEDGSPRGRQTIALWEPSLLPDVVGEAGAPVRRAANTESAEIMGRVITQGARTLTFARSRRGAEVIAMSAAEQLVALGQLEDSSRIAAYRAGYTPEDRRRLEQGLDEGELLGVASTNALELGIDVGGLDAVIVSGFPGTIASFRQQAGRAGRRGQEALVLLVSSDDPMDAYLVHHPDSWLDKPVENTVFDPANPYVISDHVLCAASEKPLTEEEVTQWGAESVVNYLIDRGLLKRRPRGIFADLREAEKTAREISIRGGAAKQVSIVEHESGRILGTVDEARAVSDVHEGAVYLHQGETYLVEKLNLPENVAWVSTTSVDYSTQTMHTTDIEMLRTRSTRQLRDGVWLADVDVRVTHTVTAYRKRLPNGDIIDVVPLEVPPESLRTRSVAYTVAPEVLQTLGIPEPLWPGTLHAAEHAAIGLLPLIATCDRWDIGGVSTVLHEDTGMPTVFVYDGYAGGAGFAEKGFESFERWIAATADAVEACECESGCPSCVQSPKCGNGNDPLFKRGAAALLKLLSAGP